MAYLYGKAFDYNDFVRQIRGYLQGHPQVLNNSPTDPQGGITVTGTGAGELYVNTESFTPAGVAGSPAGSPGPGTKYRLTCTVAGNATTSPRAQFDVEQIGISPGLLGTMLAGDRWVPDGDIGSIASPELTSPLAAGSPQHGLHLALTTSTNWVVSDTIEFRLVDHDLDGNTLHNWEEQRFTEQLPDATGDFVTEWLARFPSVAKAGASPESPSYGGLQTSYNDSESRFNVAVTAAAGFEASSSFGSQPGNGGTRFGYLSNLPFPFWLSCSADGFYAAARVGSVYEHFTLQLLDVFATGNQHALPLFFGAMSENNNSDSTSSQTDNDEHSAFFDPGAESSARFRWVDGSWYNIENRNTGYTKQIAQTAILAPYRNIDAVTGAHTAAKFPADYGWSILSHQMLPRYDGSYSLIPITLIFSGTPQDAVVGNLKFIKYVTGNGLNSEDTTEDTSVSPAESWIALQNAQLTDNDNFAVMLLE